MKELKTKRLLLRRFREADYDEFIMETETLRQKRLVIL